MEDRWIPGKRLDSRLRLEYSARQLEFRQPRFPRRGCFFLRPAHSSCITVSVLQRATYRVETGQVHSNETWAETLGLDDAGGDVPANGLCADLLTVGGVLDCAPCSGPGNERQGSVELCGHGKTSQKEDFSHPYKGGVDSRVLEGERPLGHCCRPVSSHHSPCLDLRGHRRLGVSRPKPVGHR